MSDPQNIFFKWRGLDVVFCIWKTMNLTELPAGVFDGLEHRGLFLHLQGSKGLFRNL